MLVFLPGLLESQVELRDRCHPGHRAVLLVQLIPLVPLVLLALLLALVPLVQLVLLVLLAPVLVLLVQLVLRDRVSSRQGLGTWVAPAASTWQSLAKISGLSVAVARA